VLPPNVADIETLSGFSCKPDLVELKQVMDLQHLVRCLEHTFFYWQQCSHGNGASHWFMYEAHPPEDRWAHSGRRWPDEAAANLKLWQVRFYRSMYRLFLAGAVFARAYNQPFFSYSKFESLGYREGDAEFQAYLERSATYNFRVDDDDAEDAVFGPFATWLIANAKAEARRRNFDVPAYWYRQAEKEGESRQFDLESVYAEWELMTMLLAYEHLHVKFVNGNGESALGRYKPPEPMPEKTRKVHVVLFGAFVLEEITMPALVGDMASLFLVANPVQPKPAAGSAESRLSNPYSWDIPTLLGRAYDQAPHYHNGYCAPEPPLQFFTFALRKYFNSQIYDGVLNEGWNMAPYRIFLYDSNLFEEHANHTHSFGQEILGPFHPPVRTHE
jgi:hypothetical protein